MKIFKRDLKFGNVGNDVRELQIVLKKLKLGDFVCTGFFGNKTLRGVVDFQERQGLQMSGYFGIQSRTAMEKIISDEQRENIYFEARSSLDNDVTPKDIVPDEYGCAEAVTAIVTKALGSFPEGSISTYQMYRSFLSSPNWIKVDVPLRGDIVISPTGYGNGKLSNGHVGICGMDGKIMSNSSADGLFKENYTIASWKDRYVTIGGYPVCYFRKV